MNEFYRELKRRRQEQENERLRLLQQRRAENAALTARIQQEEQEKERGKRQFYNEHIAPVKPLIDRLIDDVARATWKRGYGYSFQFDVQGATWVVGRVQWYDFNRNFRPQLHWEPILPDEQKQYSAAAIDGRSFQKSETFGLTLNRIQLQGFNRDLQRKIENDLAQAYLNGPTIGYPVSKFDSFSMRSG